METFHRTFVINCFLFLSLALPKGLFATPAKATSLPPATIVSSSGPASCLGMDITFDLGDLDFDPDSIFEVPWVIAHNGATLTDANLADFLELGALGDELSDWSGSSSLAFTPLVEGASQWGWSHISMGQSAVKMFRGPRVTVHNPSAIDLVVTGGINENLVCEGEALTLSLDNVSTIDPVKPSIGRLMSLRVPPVRSGCLGSRLNWTWLEPLHKPRFGPMVRHV